MRAKGRYVATVIIDFDFETDDIEMAKKYIHNGISIDLASAVDKIVCGHGKFSVERQLADLYEVEE